ncbi:MAG: undecaprenyl-phosphate glucose phosphotransferase [Bacteroidota bacterium]
MKYLLSLNLFGELIIISLSLLFIGELFAQADILIFCNVLWLIGTFITENYYINRLPGVLINVINLAKYFAVYYLIIFLYAKLFHEADFSNYGLIRFSVLLFIFLLLWRSFVFFLIKQTFKTSKSKQQIIIVGVSVNSVHLKEFIDTRPQYGINVLGFFSEKMHDKVNVIGNYDDVMAFCMKHNVSEIICSMDKVSKEYLSNLIDFAENNLITIRIIPDSSGVFGRNFVTTFLEYIPLLALRKNPFDEVSNKLIKRIFDIVFSLFVIVFILSWLFPVIAILILLDSKGPVLFSQERTGLLNKPFKCLKFRTMIVNPNANLMQAQRHDPRVTKFGAFLRKTSLDELPQFFNVLWGTMSVVGPRPHMLKHTEEYSQLVDKYMVRHLIKPGITGLSQVMGYRGETQHDLYLMKMRVRMDRFYIENWSFYLDLKVVYATVFSIFNSKKNVY